MNDLQRFQFDTTPIRVATHGGETWWVVADVCAALNITNHRDAASRLPHEWRGVGKIDTPGGVQEMVTCSEPGLYQLVFRSNKPEAERFRRWVFEEVLPAIRQTGTYTHPAAGNLGVLANVSQQLAGVVTDHEQRIAALEQRALPAPRTMPLEEVRLRFAGALRNAIRDSGDTDDMTSEQRGAYHRGINSKLKGLCGTGRENWTMEKYRLAADYLDARFHYDIGWIFG